MSLKEFKESKNINEGGNEGKHRKHRTEDRGG